MLAQATNSICVNEILARENVFETYEIDKTPIGSGGFGVVFGGTRKSDGKEVSLKFFGYTDRAPNISDINNEIVLMLSLVGVEGVIQIESMFYDTLSGLMPNKQRALQISYPVIVMERLGGGDLLHRIDERAKAKKPISEKYLAETFRSVMLAVDCIHKRSYVHRDIKLGNILLESTDVHSRVKLIDFGSLGQIDRNTKKLISNDGYGTLRFIAPESLGPMNREYSFASDIWQCGCTLYYMLCAEAPFKTRQDIKSGEYNTESGSHPRLSALAKDLLSKMLVLHPDERCSMEEILAHPWLSGQASESDISFQDRDYARRVKTISIHNKLRILFEPHTSIDAATAAAPPPPPPSSLSSNGSTTSSSSGDDGITCTRSGTGGGLPMDVQEGNGIVVAASQPSPPSAAAAAAGTGTGTGTGAEEGGVAVSIGRSDSNVCGMTGLDIDQQAGYYFRRFDTDQDGWLSQADLRQGVADLIIERIPSASDGSPSAIEVNSDSKHQQPQQQHRPGEREQQGAMKDSAGVRLNPSVSVSVDEMFEIMDVDHSHRVDLQQFRDFFQTVYDIR